MNVALLIVVKVLGVIGVVFLSVFVGLLYKGIDRKLAAHMQGRVGPPILQPFWDVGKLLQKENIVPDNAVVWLFNTAPFLALISTITVMMYIPMGGLPPVLFGSGDVIVIVYLLTIAGISMVIGGSSSGSPYAAVGAQREMVTMISYELPLVMVVISLAWRISKLTNLPAFSLLTFTQYPLWSYTGVLGSLGLLILLIVLLMVTPAELSKLPMDLPEAETEIAGGLLAEYSGRNLALFYITDAVKVVVMSSLIVVLFFPYGISGVLGISGGIAYVLDFLFFWVKVLGIMIFGVTSIRVAAARFKINQLVTAYWMPVFFWSLVGLGLLAVDMAL